jgi:Ferritin-like
MAPRHGRPIDDLDSLCHHLQTAVSLELSTIPLYLTALYSIEESSNREVQLLLRSVVMEEMLHMCLAANVLHAVRRELPGPKVTGEHAPSYPGTLTHSDGIELRLGSFTPESVERFCAIESPAPATARPEPGRYNTIGQFYAAIEDGLKLLGPDLFAHGSHAECQVVPDRGYYGGGGEPIVVHDLATALAALHEVVRQGEGRDGTLWDGDHLSFGSQRELAHYYRFDEIRQGRQYCQGDLPGRPTGPILLVDHAAVRFIAPDLHERTAADLPPDVARLMDVCDATYQHLLAELELALNGQPGRLELIAPLMYQLGHQARALTKIPIGGGYHAGPRFRARSGVRA